MIARRDSRPRGGAGPGGWLGAPVRFGFDPRRLTCPEWAGGTATVVLGVSLWLPWYGAGGKRVANAFASPWMYGALAVCLTVLSYLVLRGGYGKLPFAASVAGIPVLGLASCVNLALVFLALSAIADPQRGPYGIGAYVGLASATAAAVPWLAWKPVAPAKQYSAPAHGPGSAVARGSRTDAVVFRKG